MAITKLNGRAIESNTITFVQMESSLQNTIILTSGPKITNLIYPGNLSAVNTTSGQTITIIGGGFLANSNVLINGTPPPSQTFINANAISFTTPSGLSQGKIPLYVVNYDGGLAIAPKFFISGTPTWVTSPTLNSFITTTNVSETLLANSDSAITYTLAVGSSLPAGLTLAANGKLSGALTSPPNVQTTYNFSATATDAELQNSTQAFSITALVGSFITISPAYNGNTTIDLTTGNLTISNSGVWNITPCTTFAINVAMWGAGGQNATVSPTGTAGAGGYTGGTITLYTGNTYTIRVGKWDGGGLGPGDSGNGGGYTAVFSGTETFANSVLIAGGGGGGAKYYNSVQNAGAGGGSSGQAGNGGGGTQSAGGAGGVNSVYPATGSGAAGSALTGGAGAAGDQGFPGGGGGAGYYGGGGGLGRVAGDGISGGGGGGSGYLHPSLVSNGNTQVGSTGTAGNSASSLRGTAGNPDSNGKIVIQKVQ